MCSASPKEGCVPQLLQCAGPQNVTLQVAQLRGRQPIKPPRRYRPGQDDVIPRSCAVLGGPERIVAVE